MGSMVLLCAAAACLVPSLAAAEIIRLSGGRTLSVKAHRDEGESIAALIAQGPPTPAIAHLDIDDQGYAWLPEDDFVNHFAADVDPTKAKVMHAVQQPLAGSALEETMGIPAWKSLPCWFLIAEGDQAIPADAERQFAQRMDATSTEVATNHVAMVSHPDDVVEIIKAAVKGVPVAA